MVDLTTENEALMWDGMEKNSPEPKGRTFVKDGKFVEFVTMMKALVLVDMGSNFPATSPLNFRARSPRWKHVPPIPSFRHFSFR